MRSKRRKPDHHLNDEFRNAVQRALTSDTWLFSGAEFEHTEYYQFKTQEIARQTFMGRDCSGLREELAYVRQQFEKIRYPLPDVDATSLADLIITNRDCE